MIKISSRLFIFFWALLTVTGYAAESPVPSKSTICLNMIVKNESKVIQRCLGSLKGIIDYWVIVDTGSTDGTQDIIRTFMKDVPGELHEKPWKNFAHNRNEALDLARNKADYVLIIDADEALVFDRSFSMPLLTKDCYYITSHLGELHYVRKQLVKNDVNWKWFGVVHEGLEYPGAFSSEVLQGVVNNVQMDGCRSQDPKKIEKDILVLEEALKEDPTNLRYAFFLAQSHRDVSNLPEAIEAYDTYAQMKGAEPQLIFWSYYQIALAQDRLDLPEDVVVGSYSKAYAYRPSRAEPLFHLAMYLRKKNKPVLAYAIAKLSLSLPMSDDSVIEPAIYNYMRQIGFMGVAYALGKYSEAFDTCNELMTNRVLPPSLKKDIEKDRMDIISKLIQ